MIMKQTLEEAAIDFADYELRNLDKLSFVVNAKADYDNGLTRGFKAGADWQSKQSPWISVEEKIGCNTSDDCIVMDKYGEVFRAYFSSENKWLKSDNAYTEEVDNVVRWIPIPSFD